MNIIVLEKKTFFNLHVKQKFQLHKTLKFFSENVRPQKSCIRHMIYCYYFVSYMLLTDKNLPKFRRIVTIS